MSNPEDILQVTPSVAIPLAELHFRFSRSGGAGGQHVNKVETRVELLFDLAASTSLSEAQRARASQALASYIDSAGVLHLVSDKFRSQQRNREEVVARFRALLRDALKVRKRRRPTQPSPAARERRMSSKRHRSQVKRFRHPPPGTED